MPPHWGLWASRMRRGTVGDDTQTGPTFWDGGANADVHLHLSVQAAEEENRLGVAGEVSSLFRTPSHRRPFCPRDPALLSANGALNSVPTNFKGEESNPTCKPRPGPDHQRNLAVRRPFPQWLQLEMRGSEFLIMQTLLHSSC